MLLREEGGPDAGDELQLVVRIRIEPHVSLDDGVREPAGDLFPNGAPRSQEVVVVGVVGGEEFLCPVLLAREREGLDDLGDRAGHHGEPLGHGDTRGEQLLGQLFGEDAQVAVADVGGELAEEALFREGDAPFEVEQRPYGAEDELGALVGADPALFFGEIAPFGVDAGGAVVVDAGTLVVDVVEEGDDGDGDPAGGDDAEEPLVETAVEGAVPQEVGDFAVATEEEFAV